MSKYSISIQGHKTSITLEKEFFDLIQKWADDDNISVAKLIQKIDQDRDISVNKNLSGYIRIYVLKRLQSNN